MKILYFYQYFSTPKGAWGTRVYEFAKKWVELGHDVTIVTSIYAKSDLKADKMVEDQVFDGIKVKVLNVKIDNKQGFLRRIWSFIVYGVLSSWYALRLPADVVVASSGPITVGLPGLVARYFRGRKLVFETRDLWPDGAIQLGIIRSPILIKLSYWLEKRCYNAASAIITLSPGMRDEIMLHKGQKNVTSITNSANIELFGTPVNKELPEQFNNSFFAIYTGNIGLVNNSHWLLDAAIELKRRGRNDLHIVLIGEGQMRKQLEAAAEQADLVNFHILDLMPKTDLVGFLQKAAISLVPLKGVPVLDTSSPNKFFESLAAGVPIIQNTNGWMKDFLEEHGVGFTIDPDDPKALADKLVDLAADPAALAQMGAKAKQLATRYFDKDYLAKEMLDVLKSVAKTPNSLNKTKLLATLP